MLENSAQNAVNMCISHVLPAKLGTTNNRPSSWRSLEWTVDREPPDDGCLVVLLHAQMSNTMNIQYSLHTISISSIYRRLRPARHSPPYSNQAGEPKSCHISNNSMEYYSIQCFSAPVFCYSLI